MITFNFHLYEAESDVVFCDVLMVWAEEGGWWDALEASGLGEPFGKPGSWSLGVILATCNLPGCPARWRGLGVGRGGTSLPG